MDSVLATVNINIGLGKDNPVLTIRKKDKIPELVDKLIQDYQLPQKVHSIIMERVKQEIPDSSLFNQKAKETQKGKETHKYQQNQPRKQVSPLKKSNRSTSTLALKKSTLVQKENNQSNANKENKPPKIALRKSVSPIKCNTGPAYKKIEIRPSKSPLKSHKTPNKDSASTLKLSQPLRIQKLFRYLTRQNPSNIRILSPQHINIKGLDKVLLSSLQDFFERLQEHELQSMDEGFFIEKVQKLNFKHKFSRKEYERCFN